MWSIGWAKTQGKKRPFSKAAACIFSSTYLDSLIQLIFTSLPDSIRDSVKKGV